MDTSEKNWDNNWSDESTHEDSNDVACYPSSSTNKRFFEEDGDSSYKRPKLEELLIKPSTSGVASTSFNDETLKPKNTLQRLTFQDDYSSDESSNEGSSDEGLELIKASTSGLKSKAYNVESSAPKKTLHGLTYQLKLLMLFVQRVPDKQEFYLSTEMHEAGLFDDIVLQYLEDGIWRYRFLQAKHKKDDQYKIGINDLFNKKSKLKSKKISQLSKNTRKKSRSSKNTGETKPYLLKKYFESFCDIKQESEFRNAYLEEFLICTNVGFAEEAMTYFKCVEENDDPILLNFEEINEKSTDPIKYKLKKKSASKLREEFEINSKNENCFLNFIEKFRFLANYEDDELNENIENSLKKCLKIENVELADAYLQKRVLKWFESYQDKKSKYLHIKNKKEFLKSLNNNIESLLVAGYSTFYFEELKSCGVKFKDILPLREFFDHKKEKIMFIITATPKLSVLKLSQLFDELKLKQDEVILTNIDQLNCNKKISTTFFAEPSYKWLVVECHHNEIKLSRKMLNKISKMDKKKTIIIIGLEDNVLNFNKYLGLKTVCFHDKKNLFKDLTMVSQEKILDKSVMFQGEKIKLNKLIDIYSGRNIIDNLTLEKLLAETIQIGNNDAFVSDFLIEDFYIRRLLIQRELRLDILQNEEVLQNCLFIISRLDRDQFKYLNINNEWIYIWGDDKTFYNGIILSTKNESTDIFNKLCENKTKNVCRLEYIQGKFFIINISNDIDILHKFIICLEEDDLDKKQILEKKIIILADGPGCGKSIFMTRVARQLKQILSNIWVLRINLSYYAYKQEKQTQVVKSLEDIKFKDNETERAIEFLADLLFPQGYKNENKHFVRELLIHSLHCLNENMKFPTVIILFDGFDEISPTFKEKTLTLLQALRNSNVAQMWVTTRNHEEFTLEVALQSSSFFLKPLNDNDKLIFLKNFWKYNLQISDNIKPERDSEGTLNYLTELTDNTCICNDYNSITSHSKFQLSLDLTVTAHRLIYYLKGAYEHQMSEFTDNPFLLKMIAEIIAFKKFCYLEKMNLFLLYEEFIEYKWTVFRDYKDVAGKSVAGRNLFKTYIEHLTIVHQEVAFQTLFPQHNNKQFKDASNKIELLRAGLLSIHDDRLEFVHRSFAEYFVSQYFAENFQTENIQKIVFSELLVKKNYSITRRFLNKNTTFLDKLSSKTPQMIEIIRINSSDSKILYQMLEENLYYLMVKFLENLPLDVSKNAIWFYENDDEGTMLHRICENMKIGRDVKNIGKEIKNEYTLERDGKQINVLHIMTFFDENLVKQTLQFFKLYYPPELFYDLLLQVNKTGDTILHIACKYGKNITYLLEVSDENRDAIRKFLLKTNYNGETALYNTILSSDNPSLLTTLLNHVKSVCTSEEINDLFAIKNNSLNLLHTACHQTNEGILVNFLDAIKDNKEMVEKFLLETDKLGRSPLHYTVCDSYSFHRLKILIDFVNLNCSTETLYSLLCKRSCDGTTILHMVVKNFKASHGHGSLTPLLTYLFNLVDDSKDTFYELLLARDHEGQTVLHYTSCQFRYPFLLKDLLDFVQTYCSTNVVDELLLTLGN